jgi:hypothetical protein
MRTPAWQKASVAVEQFTESPAIYRTAGPTSTEIAVADAAAHLRRAARLLREAQFRIDEAEQHCPALDDLAADAAALSAEWAGRAVPLDKPDVPDWIASAAVAWRAERDRRARR